MLNNRPKTIFCDIDGTLIEHTSPSNVAKSVWNSIALPGTIDKLTEWDSKGYTIILTTGRKESLRSQTEKQLSEIGIFYDQLIMGISGGQRVLINDFKPNDNVNLTAISFCVERNKGIKEINV